MSIDKIKSQLPKDEFGKQLFVDAINGFESLNSEDKEKIGRIMKALSQKPAMQEIPSILSLVSYPFIERISNESSEDLARAHVYFKNGHKLSIIRGLGSYGGDKGLFEIEFEDKALIDKEDCSNESVGAIVGWLSLERVNYYINKIGKLPTRNQN